MLKRELPDLLTVVSVAQVKWLHGGFALRPFTTTLQLQEAQKQASGSEGQRRKPGVKGEVIQQGEGSEITDQIPHIVRPMGVIEGTSYTVLIVAGLAFAAAVVWAVVNELLIQPREYTCYNITLKRLQEDPRVTVRLGTPISGYGQETRNRQARQRIPHRTFTDQHGVERTQVQFFARGPSGNARVSAEMYQDEKKVWQYAFLYVEVDSPVPQRVVLIEPQYR